MPGVKIDVSAPPNHSGTKKSNVLR
jgi:hypothetical protein